LSCALCGQVLVFESDKAYGAPLNAQLGFDFDKVPLYSGATRPLRAFLTAVFFC